MSFVALCNIPPSGPEPQSRADDGLHATPTDDEAALIWALRSGHPGAAAAFYDQHARHVLRTLRAALGSEEDLPDLVQEVFIRGFKGIGMLRETDRVRSWLTGIALNVANYHRRSHARRNRLRSLSPEHTLPDHCEQPSLEARRSLYAFFEVLDELPTHERKALTLHYVEGMTLSAAAEACRTSLTTFKRMLSRAQNRFRRAARRRPGIQDWVEVGTRWRLRKPGYQGTA